MRSPLDYGFWVYGLRNLFLGRATLSAIEALQLQSTHSGPGLLQGPCGWFLTAVEEARIERYSWHCNRHTFASRLVRQESICAKWQNCSVYRTLQMVMRHSHLAPEHKASAVDRLVSFGNEREPERTPAHSRQNGERKAFCKQHEIVV